jgi:hypothetical protein
MPDLALGKVKDSHQAGLISFKLSIFKPTEEEPTIDFKKFKAWAT